MSLSKKKKNSVIKLQSFSPITPPAKDTVLFIRVQATNAEKIKQKAAHHNVSLSVYVDQLIEAL